MGMMTGEALRVALARAGWTRERLAREAGLGDATVYRILAHDGPIQGRRSTIEKITGALESVGALESPPETAPTSTFQPVFLSVDLPVERAGRLRGPMAGLALLHSLSLDQRDSILLREGLDSWSPRATCTYLSVDRDLWIAYIGSEIRWSALTPEERPLLALGDPDVAHDAAKRHWRVLITGAAALAFCKRGDFEYTALSVPALHVGRPAVVTISALGRPDLSA